MLWGSLVAGVACCLLWIFNCVDAYRFEHSTRPAMAVPERANQQPGTDTVFRDGAAMHPYPMHFTTDTGQVIRIAPRYIPQWAITEAQAQGQVQVDYMPGDPYRIRFKGEKEEIHWAALAWGVGLIGFFLFARRLPVR